jgi:hypothetical protein
MPISAGVTVMEVMESPASGGNNQSAENKAASRGREVRRGLILFILPAAAPKPRESPIVMPITKCEGLVAKAITAHGSVILELQ